MIQDDRFPSLRRRSSIATPGLLLLALCLAFGPRIGFAQKPPAVEPKAVAPDADALYKQHCLACHMDGNSPLPELNFANGKWKHGSSLDKIARVVGEGVPGTAMLPFNKTLSEKEIRALAAYVRAFDKSLKPEKPKKPAKPRG